MPLLDAVDFSDDPLIYCHPVFRLLASRSYNPYASGCFMQFCSSHVASIEFIDCNENRFMPYMYWFSA